MPDEFHALQLQHTCDLVPKPDICNLITSKWVYKLKRDSHGALVRHKARLVARGYKQQEGVDFNETFSPVVKHTTIRLLLSIAVNLQWEIRQLDVSNAFLHGRLDEVVFMSQPQGFTDIDKPDSVCRLRKALYGLRQAPRAWFSTLSQSLLNIGFSASIADPSLFIRQVNSSLMYILVYVDDILVLGSDSKDIKSVIHQLSTQFSMKDLGKLSFFLGISAVAHGTALFLSQSQYATDLLHRAGMTNCSPCTTPAVPTRASTKTDSTLYSNPTFYRSIAGALHYLTLTRPDLTQAVSAVCQKMHTPSVHDFNSLKRVLRYIKGTLSFGMYFHPGSMLLTGYTDANWANDVIDRRSTSGFCVYHGKNLVSWSSKKQPTVSRSSTEAEYRALASVSTELIWFKMLLTEIHLPLAQSPLILCDNIGALSLAHNPVFHSKIKHMALDYHFTREKVLAKELSVKYLNTFDQVADFFTKPLSVSRFKLLRSKLCVGDPP